MRVIKEAFLLLTIQSRLWLAFCKPVELTVVLVVQLYFPFYFSWKSSIVIVNVFY